jgi:hypothetical protein
MKRFIKFPSIKQFRDIVKDVQFNAQFVSYDKETQTLVTDQTAEMPVVHAFATEKIHGTNASVCFSEPDGFWVQSRTSIITVDNDNAQCAMHAMKNQSAWVKIIKDLAKEHNIDLSANIITVFYEFCGQGIQKRTAVEGLEKMSIIFKYFRVSPVEYTAPSDADDTVEPVGTLWLETRAAGVPAQNPEARIWNVQTFRTYDFVLDFSDPRAALEYMDDIVKNKIEESSPVGEFFGVTGAIGEGMVVTFSFKGKTYTFKVKGEKHASSKRQRTPVDSEKMDAVQQVAHAVTPAWRLEQMFDLANDTINGAVPDIRNICAYLNLVNADILKEESDVIAEAGLIPKDIYPAVAKIAREFYKDALDDIVMG